MQENPEPPVGPVLVMDDGRGPVLTAADVPVAARHVVVVLVVNEERLTTRENDIRHPASPRLNVALWDSTIECFVSQRNKG